VLEITANRVDVVTGAIAPAAVLVEGGVIREVCPVPRAEGYLLPGFVDAHVHIESSMLLPSQFARAAVVHGTLATVSDPHEIANVCGREGVELMLRDAARTCFRFHFGAPSCVPATVFETAGAVLDADEVAALLEDPRIGYLSEVMDFPGVLARSETVMAKIAAAKKWGKPVDGHAPGLRGEAVVRYVSAGITTDHECVNREEAVDRIRAGCRVAIREGSAARNFDALQPLIDEYPDDCMLCSDDKHPDELLLGHINRLVARAIAAGTDPLNAIRAASLNPIRHYGLSLGLLQVGDPADFILTDDLTQFRVRAAYLAGREVARDGQSLLPATTTETINNFAAPPITREALALRAESDRIRVIEATDGQLITGGGITQATVRDGLAVADPEHDVLKLVVVNRYQAARPAVAFVRGFGLRRGALASSVAHDSHNVVAVGVSDDELCGAINAVIANRGGLSVQAGSQLQVLPLPVAGLMAAGSCETVAADYSRLDRQAKELGSSLRAPYMTLSFMALLVIPSLKLSDRGLFDGNRFEFVPLFV
jgi:adenine deaminase